MKTTLSSLIALLGVVTVWHDSSSGPSVITPVCHAGDQLYVDQLQGPPLTEDHLHLLALQDKARGGAEIEGAAHLNN